MKTMKIATVTIPRHYTLTVILTDEKANRFRVYKEWTDPGYQSADGEWHHSQNHRKLIERYSDMASAMHLVWEHTLANNVD